MGRGRLILAAILMVAATAPMERAAATGPVSHGPVTIYQDANFTAANGVVSGTGTAGDPYVIAGWHFTATTGTAVVVRDTTASFILRDNSFDGPDGLYIADSSGTILVTNNSFVMRGTGLSVVRAEAHVVANSFIGTAASHGSAKGVILVDSSSTVEANAFLYVQYAVTADRASPIIRCNDMHDDAIVAGITVRTTVNATIECNVMTRCNAGIEAFLTIRTTILNNTIDNCGIGIHLNLDKDFVAINNTVRLSWYDQVRIETSTGSFTGNFILDGSVNGVVIVRSPILFANNTVTNHLGIGVVVSETSSDITANVMSYNSVGLSLQGGAVPHVTANVMTNNTIGIDIPYASRQAIVNLSANFVNGVNIDGAITASERVYFYHAANVTITGGVRDSGFSAGYYGSLTAQGNVVLYEVDTAHIDGTVISHTNVGVGVVSSFNVVVESATILQANIGVSASVAAAGNGTIGPVPACVVSIKNSTITIPVDPILTIGIDIHGCLANVFNSTISLVDTGIKLDASARANVTGNLVTNTSIGLDVAARANVVIRANNVTASGVGARFTASAAIVTDNTFTGNAGAAVNLNAASNITFDHNTVTANGEGVVDASSCASIGPSGGPACSALQAMGNVFASNRGDGVRVNGSTTFEADAFLGNRGTGAVVGSTSMVNVTAAGNVRDGASITGGFEVRGSFFESNQGNGLTIRGGGELRESNFTLNAHAGLRVTATYVTALHLNVSRNFDGILFDELVPPALPPLSLGGILGYVPHAPGVDPLDIHRSTLLANEHDAIRAGASVVNATHNYWGGGMPSIDVGDTIGAFQNGVTPGVRFLPYYTDAAMTTTGPVPGL